MTIVVHPCLRLKKSEWWTCRRCNKVNSPRIFVCKCGVKKSENDEYGKEHRSSEVRRQNGRNKENESSNVLTVGQIADAIRKYKELLDMGAITAEEYEKKCELLNMK